MQDTHPDKGYEEEDTCMSYGEEDTCASCKTHTLTRLLGFRV
jgi:hypothetical protein